MIDTVTPAWSIPQSMLAVSARSGCGPRQSIKGSVKDDSLLIITRAPRNSFQDVTNANRATVTIGGHHRGQEDADQHLERVGAVRDPAAPPAPAAPPRSCCA